MLKENIKATLIIATYNWPEALKVVLESVRHQSILPIEVIIADDGSQNSTKLLIDNLKKDFPIPLIHLWHEDKGFRKATILNKALAIATGEYIIQIDGDIIIHKKFIKNHIDFAEINTFIHGSRIFLNDTETNNALKNCKISFSIFNKNLKNNLNAIYFPALAKLISPKSKSLKKTRGCNFSCWKKDIVYANGYNENMIGWGLEDTELSARLINNGILKRHIKFGAIQYHLNHKTFSRSGFNLNETILKETIEKKKVQTENGIIKQ